MKINYANSRINAKQIRILEKRLEPERARLIQAAKTEYLDDRASINLCCDKTMMKTVKKIIQLTQSLNPVYLVVVGIGGSNLGSIAVQEAILGKYYNQLRPKLQVLYADTVDTDAMNAVITLITPALKKRKKVILNVVSKSGSTTETIANFEVLLDVVQKYQTKYADSVVVTTNKNSKLWNLGVEKGFTVLEIPEKVGGRYSVLSPVGLYPLGLLGINISELLKGAFKMRSNCLRPLKSNPAAKLAMILYAHYKQGKTIADLFLFSNGLEGLGKWYRQLIAESLGKEFNNQNKRINTGITPIVSVGSTDLHSMVQLYLGGPCNEMTMFVDVATNKETIKVPKMNEFNELVPGIQGKSLKVIMDAILQGTLIAFKKTKRPFVTLELANKKPFMIGQFLQLMMMMTMYLGHLLDVNPFDQPNVETYKIETKRLLK
ncbi:hypothetical protein CL622_05475 [archaeon]|nr:hypothetical protein [archaeon]